MPITLDTPITRPAVTRKETVSFAIDLEAGTVSMTFAHLTAEGQRIGESSVATSLFTPQGAPRFTMQLYGSIKETLYAIALEDGLVAGTIE